MLACIHEYIQGSCHDCRRPSGMNVSSPFLSKSMLLQQTYACKPKMSSSSFKEDIKHIGNGMRAVHQLSNETCHQTKFNGYSPALHVTGNAECKRLSDTQLGLDQKRQLRQIDVRYRITDRCVKALI